MNSIIKDHRQIGQEQELFAVDEQVGPGLPLWLPRGAVIRRELEKYMTELEMAAGYQHVSTPHLAKLDLYKKSGHWEHYKKDMFPIMKRENDEYVLRPMNCPHHIQIFAHRPRSYKELPLRIAEFGTIYRWEHSGELSGLIRVRNMTLNDAHIFCSPDQLKDEFIKVVRLIEKVYKDLHLKDCWYRLSLHDPKDKKKYADNPKMWEDSETALREALRESGVEYKEAVGEAAFYGPKLDIQIPNVLGKDETISTVQIDFYLPTKFRLGYIGQDGEKHPVIMIHRAIISTLERMIGFLIEQYQGAFPAWLAPVQVVVLPISDTNSSYGKQAAEKLKDAGFRATLDDRPETLQARIRDAQLQKIPYMLVIGRQEEEAKTVAVRLRSGETPGSIKLEEFIAHTSEKIAARSDLW